MYISKQTLIFIGVWHYSDIYEKYCSRALDDMNIGARNTNYFSNLKLQVLKVYPWIPTKFWWQLCCFNGPSHRLLNTELWTLTKIIITTLPVVSINTAGIFMTCVCGYFRTTESAFFQICNVAYTYTMICAPHREFQFCWQSTH